MHRPTVILFSLLLAFGTAPAADPIPIKISSEIKSFDVVPTATGYAAVFLQGQIVAFQILDATGQPTGGEIELGNLGVQDPTKVALVQAGNGFVVYLSGNAGQGGLNALTVGPDGAEIGTMKQVVTNDIHEVLGDWDVTDAGSTHLLVYSKVGPLFGGWPISRLFAQMVGLDGAPSGDPHALSYGQYLMGSVNLSATSTGFLAAWHEFDEGVRTRPVLSDGRAGPPGPERIPGSRCSGSVAAYGGTGRGAIVYIGDCASRKPVLRLRVGNEYTDPIPLDIDDRKRYRDSFDADGPRDDVGVAMELQPLLPGPGFWGTWLFGQYDTGGNRRGPFLDLGAYGVTSYKVQVLWDAARATYLLHWLGGGPQGQGAYTLRVPAN